MSEIYADFCTERERGNSKREEKKELKPMKRPWNFYYSRTLTPGPLSLYKAA